MQNVVGDKMVTLKGFCEQPSEEQLENFPKEQLLQLASNDHIDIPNDDKKLKKNIKHVI